MAAARAVDGNDNGAGGKTCSVVVQSETMDRNNILGSALLVPVSGDSKEGFGFSGNMVPDDDDLRFDEDDHGESTEYSSSFGPSCSGSDDETKSDMNAMEVDSPFLGQINVADTTSVPKMVRHKQVTAAWRKAVGPLMWRCQWLELRMKNLLSQVSKYDKELALINHEKALQLEMIKADSSKSDLTKLDFESHDRKIMKRRRRQRAEDIMDVSLYMKKHQILSYYENKNNEAETDGLVGNDGFNTLGDEDTKRSVHPNNTLLESKESDSVLEQYSLREILVAIDGIQSRIQRLQGQLSMVDLKHEELPPDVDHAQVEASLKSQKARYQLSSCKKDGSRVQKKKDMHSLLQREDTMCRRPLAAGTYDVNRNILHEGATQLNADEITFEMLFGADNPLNHAHVGEFCKESADDVLIDNQAAQEEGYQQFEKVKLAAEKHAELVNKVAAIPLSNNRENTGITQMVMVKPEPVAETGPIVKHEPVEETAPAVTLVGPGNKRGPKPKRKHGSSRPASKGQTDKSANTAAKKKTKKEPQNVEDERPVLLVAVNTRRSQRVRKHKVYESD